jgi:hypothetical protein
MDSLAPENVPAEVLEYIRAHNTACELRKEAARASKTMLEHEGAVRAWFASVAQDGRVAVADDNHTMRFRAVRQYSTLSRERLALYLRTHVFADQDESVAAMAATEVWNARTFVEKINITRTDGFKPWRQKRKLEGD